MAIQSTPKQKPQRTDSRSPFVVIVSTIIFTIIVVAFVFLGPTMSNNPNLSMPQFGSYDGKPIIYQENSFFANKVVDYEQSVRQKSIQTDYYILQRAFKDAALRLAYLSIAESQNLSLSIDKVYEYIKKSNPNFTLKQFNAIPNKEAIIAGTRDDLLAQKIELDFYDGPIISKNELAFIQSTYKTQRSFKFVKFDKADYPETDVIAYAKTNSALFTKLNLASITLGDKAKADEIRAKLASNPSLFDELAKDNSEGKYASLNGPWSVKYIYEIKANAPFEGAENIVSNLKKGQVSEVIKDGDDYIVVLAQEDPVLIDTTVKANIDLVKNYIEQNEVSKIEDSILAQAKKYTDGTFKDVASIAKASNRTVSETEAFPINLKLANAADPFIIYGQFPLFPSVRVKGGEENTDLGGREDFFTKVFSLQKNQVSEIIKGTGAVYIFELLEEKPADATAFGMFDSSPKVILQQLSQQDVYNTIVEKSKLTDNFSKAFQEYEALFGTR